MNNTEEEEVGEIHKKVKVTPYSKVYFEAEGLTAAKIFRVSCERYPNNDFLGFRPYIEGSNKRGQYVFTKYKDVNTIVTHFASGLRKLGLGKGDKVGIFAKNCPEWNITDYACCVQSMVTVPVYDSYQLADCKFIIIHSDMKAIIISQDKVSFMLDLFKSKEAPLLQYLIVIDDPKNPNAPKPEGVYGKFSDIIELGKNNPVEDVMPAPDDTFTLEYTSGTTGTPKGAIVTHQNAATTALVLMTRATPPKEGEQDYYISYLPLAHIFERMLEFTILQFGCAIGFYSGSMSTITDDLQTLKPTIMTGVPRVFCKTYAKIKEKLAQNGWFKNFIFRRAYNAKLNNMKKLKPTPWADSLVFNQIKENLGGRIRLCYNGAASLPPEVSEFISVCLGVIIAEGYGSSETAATITCSEITAFDFGTVGAPYPNGGEVRLVSVPELDYHVTDKPYPRGEICIRGPEVFVGYYKDEELTKKAFDKDGFFKTGDIGMWVPGPHDREDGKGKEDSLKIIDRKKNIFKLSQGEFVCAENLELIYEDNCDFFNKVMVHAPSSSAALVAFVVPEWDALVSESNSGRTHSDKWANGAVKNYWEQLKAKSKEGKKEGAGNADAAASTTSSSSSSSSSSETKPAEASTGDDFHCPIELRKELKTDPELRKFFLGEFARIAGEHKDRIHRFEIPLGLIVCVEDWTDTNRLMTPSLKKKRESIRRKYEDEYKQQLDYIEATANATKSHSSAKPADSKSSSSSSSSSSSTSSSSSSSTPSKEQPALSAPASEPQPKPSEAPAASADAPAASTDAPAASTDAPAASTDAPAETKDAAAPAAETKDQSNTSS